MAGGQPEHQSGDKVKQDQQAPNKTSEPDIPSFRCASAFLFAHLHQITRDTCARRFNTHLCQDLLSTETWTARICFALLGEENGVIFFREWSQKALEEEEKRKKEKKMNQQQQQHQQQQQQQANGERGPVDMNGNAHQKTLPSEDNAATKQEPPPVATKALKKNFASMDCGAKVLSANSEAQSPGNVISPHKDEYLLNKARSRKLLTICLNCLLPS